MKATKTINKVDSIMETLAFVLAIIFLMVALYESRSEISAIIVEFEELTYSVRHEDVFLPTIAMNPIDPIVLEHMDDERTDEQRRIDTYERYSKEIGETLDVDPYLILAVIEAESQYNPDAHGNGAVGLMQLIPSCHKNTMAKYGYSKDDLFDPYKNIQIGAEYLSSLTHKYDDISFALVCYNKGEGGALSSGVKSTKYSEHVLNIYNKLTGGDI